MIINLENLSMRRFLAMPGRPGDVIMVPANGQVLVDGWVAKPGSYRITEGLKVLGAVVAAGGALFPAKTSDIQIIRKERDGQETVLVLNLDKVQRGEIRDIAVRDGDVIEVPSSDPKLVPYGIYTFLAHSVGVGAYASAPVH
jgi:protein involved in polysaccharide export with SLBB domain